MDWTQIIAGVLFVTWPFTYRYGIGRARRQTEATGGDVERFDRSMDRTWIHVMLVVIPIAGVALIVAGIVH
jgi:hypothetical protein